MAHALHYTSAVPSLEIQTSAITFLRSNRSAMKCVVRETKKLFNVNRKKPYVNPNVRK